MNDGARDEVHVGDLGERHLDHAAVGVRRADGDVADGLPATSGTPWRGAPAWGSAGRSRTRRGRPRSGRRSPPGSWCSRRRSTGRSGRPCDGRRRSAPSAGPARRTPTRSVTPGHGAERRLDGVGGLGELREVVAVDLDRVLALHARGRLLDVVLDVLREVELDARESSRRACCSRGRGSASPCRGPCATVSMGLSGARISTLKKPVASVPSFGPALVREHGDDLGHLREDLAQALDVGVAGLQRDRGRHGAAHVEVALLEAWAGIPGRGCARR